MKKIREVLGAFTEIVEIVAAIIVAIATMLAIIGIVPQLATFWAHRTMMTVSMSRMMSQILTIVIGSELIRMLLQPNPETVTEVLVFLIARHIIVHQTTPMENLVSVIAIAILYILRHLLISDAKREEEKCRFDRMTRFFSDTARTFDRKPPMRQMPEAVQDDQKNDEKE